MVLCAADQRQRQRIRVCVRVCEIQTARRRSVLDGCKVPHGSLVAMTELALRARARREHAALIRDSDRVIEATRDLHRKLILHERVSQRHQSRFTVTWHECMRRLEWQSIEHANERERESHATHLREDESARPSWPQPFEPQANSSPVRVMASVCSPPHAIAMQNLPANASILVCTESTSEHVSGNRSLVGWW